MPRYMGLVILTFVFFISIAIKCSENCLCEWQLGLETNCFLLLSDVTNFMSLWFLIFSIVFPKTELFISVKKSFSNSFFASFLYLLFISMYVFNHTFWLNWITLRTFFSFKPWFSACFKALMWITYFSLSSMLQISFSTFSTFFRSGRNDTSLWLLSNAYEYSVSNSRKYPVLLFSSCFFMKSSLNLHKFFTHLKLFTGNFWDIVHPYKLFALCFYHKFFIYLLFALAYLCFAWQIPPLIPFSTINTMS